MKQRICFLLLTALFMCSICLSIPAFATQGPIDILGPNSDHVFYRGFTDMDDFDQYLNQIENLPTNFTKPLGFESIGTLESWVDVCANPHQFETLEYYYCVKIPEDNVKLWIHFEHGVYKEWSAYPELDMYSVSGDMRTLRDTVNLNVYKQCIIRRGDLVYHYVDGKLFGIWWQKLGETLDSWVSCSILAYESYDDGFTYSSGSFMEKLLSMRDSEFQQAQDILLSLGTSKGSNPDTSDPVILFAVLLPTSATSLVLLLRKKKHH